MRLITDDEESLLNSTILVPTIGCGAVDQLTIDLLCFNFGKKVGAIQSDHIGYFSSPNPYDSTSNDYATAIDVYLMELPTLGKCLALRISSLLPSVKKELIEFADDIVEFYEKVQALRIVLVRSAPAMYGIDSQIREWPRCFRQSHQQIFDVKELEGYSEIQVQRERAVKGDLIRCMETKEIVLSCIYFFVNEGINTEEAIVFAELISGKSGIKKPRSWDLIC